MYFSSLFPSLPPESTPTRLSARWMHFPVCVSLQGHVWHSRQGALEAVDQRDWHSNPWLLPSLMDSICITESIRHFWAFFSIRVFVFHGQKTTAECFHPHTNTDHKHTRNNARAENVKTADVYSFGNLPNIWDRRRGWPVWAVIGLRGSIMHFNVAGWQGWPH